MSLIAAFFITELFVNDQWKLNHLWDFDCDEAFKFKIWLSQRPCLLCYLHYLHYSTLILKCCYSVVSYNKFNIVKYQNSLSVIYLHTKKPEKKWFVRRFVYLFSLQCHLVIVWVIYYPVLWLLWLRGHEWSCHFNSSLIEDFYSSGRKFLYARPKAELHSFTTSSIKI